MKILFLTHYFPPEVGAPQTRIFELARLLKQRGHQVSILTPFPHYPSGQIPEPFRGKIFMRETMEGLNVIRTWVYATPNKGFVRRIANHLSFMVSAMVLGPFLLRKHHVMVVESPPLFTGMAGVWLKWLWRMPYIFNVADLWPESAVALGALTNKPAIKLAEWQEQFLYRQSARITAVTTGIRDTLIQRGLPPQKVVWLPNGVDIDYFRLTQNREQARQILGWDINKTIAMYGGTHGLAQGLDVVLYAAQQIKHRNDIELILVGDGADKKRLLELKSGLNLDNVHFLDTLPKNQMPTALTACDISLVILKDLPLFKSALPSKMYEAMAMQRPIALGVTGEAERLIIKAGAGICIPPENPTALAQAITTLADNPDLRVQFGEQGRAFVTENFRRELLADRLETILQTVYSENHD